MTESLPSRFFPYSKLVFLFFLERLFDRSSVPAVRRHREGPGEDL